MNKDNDKGTKFNGDTEFDILKLVEETIKEEAVEEIQIEDEDTLLSDINASLASQICKAIDGEEVVEIEEKPKRSNKLRIAGISLLTVFLALAMVILTPFGRNLLFKAASEYAYGKMTYNDGSDVVLQEVIDDVIEDADSYAPEELEDSEVNWNTDHTADGPRQEEGVVNILLLGEEAIESGGGRGRTDLMIIATMNTKDKSVKLTSLMRDILVQIPGYKDNKLNAAYEIGGIPLLYETVEQNFDVKLDGYVLVGFDNFETIINKLGGVRISLTSTEANYLNTTNYISKPQYRNVKSGSQILNGNQALGYCRIRYVATGDRELNDYGRTSRQRVVLNAIFDAYKSKNLGELAFMLNDILPLLTTDIPKADFENYLKLGVSMGIPSIENLRIPVDNSFDEGFVRKMSVLIPDLEKNVEELHKFIFGN